MSVFLNKEVLGLLVLLLGFCFGSFVSVLAYRIPKGKKFVFERSICPNCKKSIPWFLNIPILSYLFLGGKSRCCGKKIGISYLLLEIISGLGFLAIYLIFGSNGLNFPMLIYFALFVLSLTIFVIDLKHQIIPDSFSFLFLIFSLFLLSLPFYDNLFAGFFYASFLLLLYFLTKGRGMGLGDVKLTLGMGTALGLFKGLLFLSASFLTGGIVASILLLTKKAHLKQKIAFGPFLIIGFWIVAFLSNSNVVIDFLF